MPLRRGSRRRRPAEFDWQKSATAGADILERAGVAYAIIGRVAVWAYVDPDAQGPTKDVDFAVPHERINDAARAAEELGYGVADLGREINGYRIFRGDVRIDLIDGHPRMSMLFSEAIRACEKEGEKELVRLLTDLVDPDEFRAKELALLYHERWESEVSYDEVKVHLQTVKHGSQHTEFRSKSPPLVEQEFRAMLATYNLVRELMLDAAKAYDIPPRELSFVDSLVVIGPGWTGGSERRQGADRLRGPNRRPLHGFPPPHLAALASCSGGRHDAA